MKPHPIYAKAANIKTDETAAFEKEFDSNGGCWEDWMEIGGITTGMAFDAGYDAEATNVTGDTPKCPYAHRILAAAFASGWRQYREENN